MGSLFQRSYHKSKFDYFFSLNTFSSFFKTKITQKLKKLINFFLSFTRCGNFFVILFMHAYILIQSYNENMQQN
jgi:hypothetical protein